MTKTAVTPFDRHSRKPHNKRKPYGSVFYRSRVMAAQSFTLLEYAFSTFFYTRHPMTFIDEPNQYCLQIQQMCIHELPVLRLSKVID